VAWWLGWWLGWCLVALWHSGLVVGGVSIKSKETYDASFCPTDTRIWLIYLNMRVIDLFVLPTVLRR